MGDLEHELAERERRIKALQLDIEALRGTQTVLERELKLLAAVNERDLMRVKAEIAGAARQIADNSGGNA